MSEQVKLEMFTADLDSELELQYSQEGVREQRTGTPPFFYILCPLCRRLNER